MMTAPRIRWLTCATTFVLGVVAFTLLAPSASTDTTAPLYAKMKQRFTTAKPGHSTGWSFDGALKPYPAGEQVPPQRSVDFVFPKGTRFRLGAVPSCLASDEQIMSGGLGACPADSQVGSGQAGLFLGAAGTLTVEVQLFAAEPGLVAAFTSASGLVLRVLRATAGGNRITATLPPEKLPGGYELAVVTFTLEVPRAGTKKRPLLQTPKTCPKSKRWKFVYLPRYDEPYGVQRSTATVRCRRES
jgi:hypothetical protein